VARRHLLRASDSDREEVVGRLRAATAEGRLLVAELEQRLEVAFHARTYGELDALVDDLPASAPTSGGDLPASAPASTPVRRRPGLPVVAWTTLALGVLLSAVAASATTEFARFNAAFGPGGPGSAQGRPEAFAHAGSAGMLAVSLPLIMIVFLVAVCAGLGWLFSQDSDAPQTAPPDA
jgi:hypothetical protein